MDKCRRGLHDLDGPDGRVRPDGRRECRACRLWREEWRRTGRKPGRPKAVQPRSIPVDIDVLLGTTPDKDWEDRAACRGMDPNIFHPQRGSTNVFRQAIAACAQCEVRYDCLAMHLGEKEGVWGGLSYRARRQVRARLNARSEAA